jgi:hypothetical protein
MRAFAISRGKRFAFLFPLGLLMLSMAVFAWGLQYKLSLYKVKQSITHMAPEAKLLSQKERPVIGQAIDAAPTDVPPPAVLPVLLFLTIAPVLFPRVTQFLQAGSRERAAAPLPLCIRSVFFRPPPVR